MSESLALPLIAACAPHDARCGGRIALKPLLPRVLLDGAPPLAWKHDVPQATGCFWGPAYPARCMARHLEDESRHWRWRRDATIHQERGRTVQHRGLVAAFPCKRHMALPSAVASASPPSPEVAATIHGRIEVPPADKCSAVLSKAKVMAGPRREDEREPQNAL